MKADIQAHGQLEPIRTLGGCILDGRNRYRACTELGIDPKREEIDGAVDPVQFVLSANLLRRHLTAGQRAMVAARVLEIEKASAKARQRAGGGDKKSAKAKESDPVNVPEPSGKGDARDRAGDRVKVGGRSVDHAAKVLATGAPALVEAVDRGKVSISLAAKLSELPQRRQLALLKAGAAAARKAVQKAKGKEQPRHALVRRSLHGVVKLLEQLEEETGGASSARSGEDLRPREVKSLVALAQRAQRVLADWQRALSRTGHEPDTAQSDPAGDASSEQLQKGDEDTAPGVGT